MADPNTPQSYLDFSAQIKAKYPQYQNLDDLTLAQKVIEKYPVYADKVHFFGVNPLGSGSAGFNPAPPVQQPKFTGFTDAELEAGRLGASVPGMPGTVPNPAQPYEDRQGYFRRQGFVQYGEPGFLRTPDQQEQINNLPLRARLAATAPQNARHITQQTEEMLQAKDLAEQKGAQFGREAALETVTSPVGEVEVANLPQDEASRQQRVQQFTQAMPGTAGVIGGTGSFVGGMAADPMTYALMGLGLEGRVGKTLLSAGFAGQMGYGAYQQAGDLGRIWDNDSIPREQKVELGTQLLLNTVMAGMTGAHAVTGALTPDHPVLKEIPEEDRAEVAQRVNDQIDVTREKAGPAPDTRPVQDRATAAVLGVDAASRPMPGTTPVVENGQVTQAHVAAENDYFQKAKVELGEGASISQIAQRAQQLKQQASVSYPPTSTPEINATPESTVNVRPQDFLEKVGEAKGTSPEVVAGYRSDFQNGKPVEPLSITFDKAGNVLEADGRHRALAAVQAGVERVPVTINRKVEGTEVPIDESAKVDSMVSNEPPPAPKETMQDNQPTSQAEKVIARRERPDAKTQSIEQAKQTMADNKAEQLKSLKAELDKAQAQLSLAQSAQKRGSNYGAKSPEEMDALEQNIRNLKESYLDNFRTYVKAAPEEESNRLISEIEAPIYEKVGKVMQLQKMLHDDETAKTLRQALAEDMTKDGLSAETQKGIKKFFPNEQVSDRLSKGENGQKNRIRRALGEMVNDKDRELLGAPKLNQGVRSKSYGSEEVQFHPLSFAPDVDSVKRQVDALTKGIKGEPVLTREMLKGAYRKALNKHSKTSRPVLETASPEDIADMARQLNLPKSADRATVIDTAVKHLARTEAENTPGRVFSEDEKARAQKALPRLLANLKSLKEMRDKVAEARKLATDMRQGLNEPEFKPITGRPEAPPEQITAISDLARKLKSGAPIDPAAIRALEEKEVLPHNISNGQRADILQKIVDANQKPVTAPVDPRSPQAKYLDELLAHPNGFVISNRISKAPAVRVNEESPLSQFVKTKLPGTVHEISVDNLRHVIGEDIPHTKVKGQITFYKNFVLSPEQRSMIDEAPDPQTKRMLKAEFAREKVREIVDHYSKEIKEHLDLVNEVRRAKGLTEPTELQKAVEAMKKKPEVPAEKQLPPAQEAPVVQTPDKVSAPAPAQETSGAEEKSSKVIAPRPEENPNPKKPPIEAPPAQEATAPALTPQEAEARNAAKNLEAQVRGLIKDSSQVFNKLGQVAREVGTDRLGRYQIYKKGLEVYTEGLKKNDPWVMLNTIKEMRKVEERGSVGVPGVRGLSPADIQESYRVYSHMTLSRYEAMTDLQIARMRDKINDGVLERAVRESKDPNVMQRFEDLQQKAADTDPIASLGSAIINGVEVTPAEAGKGIMRARMGEQKLDKIRLRKELDDYAKRWDKASINESTAFIDAIEHGGIDRVANQGNVNPTHAMTGTDKTIAEKLGLLLDDRMIKLKSLGEGFLDNYLENYFPHIWSNVGKARDIVRQTLARRPLSGTNSFLKQREYDTFREGLANGLQPLSWNPVKLTLARIEQIDKFLAAHKMKQDFIKEGLVKFFKAGADVPRDWVRLDDSIFRAEKRDQKTGAIMRFGDYYAPKELAKAFNNHLSPGLSGNRVFGIVRQYGNGVNQANLVGGVFHLIESGFNTTVSDLALSLQQATTKGQRLAALKSSARMPVSVVDAYFNSGRKMMAEAMSPGKFADYARSVDAMSKAGGSLQIDPQYLNQSFEKLRTNWKTAMDQDSAFKTRVGAVLRVGANAVGTVLEKSNWFVMEHFVPRMKAATFHRMAEQIYDKMGPNPNETLLRMELDKAWDSVDNRLGELIYDNLFWNRRAKDAALVTFRSTGWNLGTIREIGGGGLDLGKNVYDIAKGRKTQLSARSAYTIALTGAVMGIGATMTYFATGHAPQSLTDYFYPPDGTTGPDGKPNRHYLKSYINDVVALTPWDATGLNIKKTATTVAHKLSPMWSQAAELVWNNADYYGREIVHPGDSILQDTKNIGSYLGRSAQPFLYQNFKEENRRDARTSSKIEALFGILPAPKWAGQTKAEKLAYDLAMRSMPQGPRDQAEFDRGQEVGQLRNKYANKNASITDMVKEAQSGKIRYSDINNIVRESSQTPLERHLSRLSAKDALQVWDAATPEERNQIRMSVLKKYSSIYNDAEPQDRANLQQKFLEVLKFQQAKKTAEPGGAP